MADCDPTDTYGAPPTDLRASPLLASSHAGLPPAFIQVMELDPIRDDGIVYEKVLREAGVPTRLVRCAFSCVAHRCSTILTGICMQKCGRAPRFPLLIPAYFSCCEDRSRCAGWAEVAFEPQQRIVRTGTRRSARGTGCIHAPTRCICLTCLQCYGLSTSTARLP